MTTQYADYSYYTGTYLGSSISAPDFDALALRASAYIDRLTFKRAQTEVDPTNVNAIKMACCALAELLQSTATEARAVRSERVGDYSVTYTEDSDPQKVGDKIAAEAGLWLADTGLMFPGFYDGEYGGTA